MSTWQERLSNNRQGAQPGSIQLLWACLTDFYGGFCLKISSFTPKKSYRTGLYPSHTAQISMAKSSQMFPERLVRLRGDVEWLARSPDLSICEFFSSGTPKGKKVFNYRPRTPEELMERIREEVIAMPVKMCRRAVKNSRNRLQECIAADGRHPSDIIFKTRCKKK